MNWQRKVHIVILAASVFLLVLIFSRMNFTKIWHAFVGITWKWVICVLLLNVLNTWIEAHRWRLILSSVKKGVKVRSTFAAILVGVVGNTILPFRFGDGARVYFLANQEKIDMASSLSTTILDRIADITLFLALSAITAIFFPFPQLLRRISLVSGIVLSIVLIFRILLINFGWRLESILEGSILKGRLGQRISKQMNRFTMGLSALKDAGTLLPVGILSAVSWGIRFTMVWVMFRAFHLSLPAIAAAVILIFMNFGMAAINTPANLGGFELAVVAAFKLFLVDTELAMSYAIVLHLVEVIPIVLLGLIVLYKTFV